MIKWFDLVGDVGVAESRETLGVIDFHQSYSCRTGCGSLAQQKNNVLLKALEHKRSKANYRQAVKIGAEELANTGGVIDL
jgi:hypothetical protein